MPSDDLTRQEFARLAELEDVIERAEQDRGQALLEVHDQQLYRASYATFEQYCQQRWSISGNYGRQLIRHAKSLNQTMVGLRPANERQARELERLEPEQAEKVMQKAAQSGDKVTARKIRQARAEVIKAEPPKRYIANSDEQKRRSEESARLWQQGFHHVDICKALRIAEGTLMKDLALQGITGKRPVAGLKPQGHPVGEVREWRDRPPSDDPNVIHLKLVPGKTDCQLDQESADRMINNADAGIEHLQQYVQNGYELTSEQTDRLMVIRNRLDAVLSNKTARRSG